MLTILGIIVLAALAYATGQIGHAAGNSAVGTVAYFGAVILAVALVALRRRSAASAAAA
jgi:hypothetical protein